MIVWTPTVLGCLICMRFFVLVFFFFFFRTCTCSAQLIMFYMEKRTRNTLIIIIISPRTVGGHVISIQDISYEMEPAFPSVARQIC